MPTARAQTPMRILPVAAAVAARDRSWTRAVLAGDPRTIDVLDVRRAGGVATTTISADLEGLRTDPVARLDSALGTAASLRC